MLLYGLAGCRCNAAAAAAAVEWYPVTLCICAARSVVEANKV